MISGTRVKLVPLAHTHLPRTRAWANDPELMRLMNREHSVAEDEHAAWFESLGRRNDCAYFAIETTEGSEHVGNVWLWAIDAQNRKAELRIVIGDARRRHQGLGVEAIEAACRHAFERLDLHRIYAYVLTINPAGRRAFERAGFALEGTLAGDRWTGDRFVDTYLLAKMASPVGP
jgi:RimJ/RimL family protein N-acetyltransferase